MKKIIGIGLMFLLFIPLAGQNLIDIDLNRLSSVYHQYFYMAFLENIEIILFITNDGKMIATRGEVHGVRIPGSMRKIISFLKQNNKTMSDLIIIIHNHNKDILFSTKDKQTYKKLKDVGFAGKFQVYWPKSRKILTLINN